MRESGAVCTILNNVFHTVYYLQSSVVHIHTRTHAGLEKLTNIQRGHTHGEMTSWTAGRRRQFGVFLLHKAFLSFLLDPPQPVGPHDL